MVEVANTGISISARLVTSLECPKASILLVSDANAQPAIDCEPTYKPTDPSAGSKGTSYRSCGMCTCMGLPLIHPEPK